MNRVVKFVRDWSHGTAKKRGHQVWEKVLTSAISAGKDFDTALDWAQKAEAEYVEMFAADMAWLTNGAVQLDMGVLKRDSPEVMDAVRRALKDIFNIDLPSEPLFDASSLFGQMGAPFGIKVENIDPDEDDEDEDDPEDPNEGDEVDRAEHGASPDA